MYATTTCNHVAQKEKKKRHAIKVSLLDVEIANLLDVEIYL